MVSLTDIARIRSRLAALDPRMAEVFDRIDPTMLQAALVGVHAEVRPSPRTAQHPNTQAKEAHLLNALYKVLGDRDRTMAAFEVIKAHSEF